MIQASERFALLAEIQQEFENEAAGLPPALRSEVLRSYPADDYDSPGLLSLAALPYWLGDALHVGPAVCRDLAVGNLFLLHLFQSFDSIVDEDRPQVDTRSQVVLGNLCYHLVLARYLPHLPPGAAEQGVFWERMAAYWREWAACMLWETTGAPYEGAVDRSNGRRPPYERGFADEYVYISAHKAAALKICPTALALIAGRVELIPALENAIDGMHAVMQLVDDLFDWQEDYFHGRYNALLGLMVAQGYLDPAGEPDAPAADRLPTILMESQVSEEYLQEVRRIAAQATAVISTLQARLAQPAAHISAAATDATVLEPWTRLINGMVEQVRYRIDQYQGVPLLFSR